MSIYPSIGLTWLWPGDPTQGGGVPAPYGQFLIRLDEPMLYWKFGQANTAWAPIGFGDFSATFAGGAYFGNGADGDHVVVGDEVITADMMYRNLTVPAGTTLKTNGYRVFVSELATVDGTVHNNGEHALGPADQAGAAGNSGSVSGGSAGGGGQGFAGGAGGGGNVNQAPFFYLPVTQAPAVPNYNVGNPVGQNGGVPVGYGMGGGGGAGSGGGGSGGPAISTTGAPGGDPRTFPQMFTLRISTVSQPLFAGGTGGGGGGRGTSVPGTYGAGGGAGGGNMVFAARNLTGSGEITCKGGNGNNGANCNNGIVYGGIGAGGGGGGGFLSVVTGNREGNVTLSSAGGIGGVGTGPDASWNYTGGNGANGNAGYVLDYNLSD